MFKSNNRFFFTLFIAVEIAIAAISILVYGIGLDALQTTTRLSGRLSLLVFSLIFLSQTSPFKKHWLPDRPYLIFAIVHGIHLCELALFVTLSDRALVPIRVLGGAVAYLFIFVMPFAEQFRKSLKITDSFFARLELGFQAYIWLIFLLTYIPRVMGTLADSGGTYWQHVNLLVWVIGMPLIRIAAYLKLTPARNN